MKAHKFDRPVRAITSGVPETVRLSTALAALRRGGRHATAATLEKEQREVGASCPEHGALTDPVLLVVDTAEGPRVAFGCPWCSSPAILAAWEKEGMRS